MKYCLQFFFFAIVLSSSAISLHAQSVEIAHSGPLGVYITTGGILGSPSHPANGISVYRIERKADGQTEWKLVAEIHAPESLSELRTSLASALRDAPYYVRQINIQIENIWSRIEHYQELDSLGVLSSMLIVRIAAGAMYLDRDVKQGTTYNYRVSTVGANGTVSELHTQSITFRVLKSPGEVYRTVRFSADTNSIHMLWHKNDTKIPVSMNIYRKSGFGNFIKTGLKANVISLKDTLFFSVIDTTVKAGVRYSYYLEPLDYYGNSAPFSDTIIAQAVNARQIKLPDHIRAEVISAKSMVHLSWKFNENKQAIGIRIYRSEDITGKFKRIGEQSAKEATFTDATILPEKTYYYYLTILTTTGEESEPTAKVFALTRSDRKPLPPFALSASAQKDGVHLAWYSSDRNLRGFYLYRGEGIHRAKLIRLAEIIPFHDSITTFLDSDKTLSPKKVYSYCTQALSTSDIEGALSDTTRVQPMGVTVPPAPINFAAVVSGSKVKLFWDEMRTSEPSVIGYNIYRREQGAETFTRIGGKELSSVNNNFVDSTTQPEKTYEYYLRTVDGYGGISENSIGVSAQISGKQISRAPVPVALKAEAQPEGISLSWGEMIEADISGFKIYRHESNSQPEVIISLGAESTTYLDRSAKKGNIYWYSLSSENAEKSEGMVSKETRIRF